MTDHPMFVTLADVADPSDPAGRTYRQINAARTHAIPVGSLVEIENGARLFVVMHTRDCDKTPLYELSPDPEDTTPERQGYRNSGWSGGYGEEGLKVIRRCDSPTI